MKLFKMSFLRRFLTDEQGQSLVFLWLFGLFFIGAAGISMDLSHGYVARQQLQASTNAAALSGAVYLSNAYLNTSSATAAVTQYSSVAGNLNATSSLTNVQLPTTSFVCLATVTKSMGIPCLGTGAGYNAMIVTQTADVKTWFAKLFGIPVFHLSATAYATPGGAPAPLNMVIIVDTTGSMTAADPNCPGSSSQLECAKNGVAIMLNSLPFPADAPVALFTFPNIQASTAPNDLTSSGSVTQVAYSTPALGSSYTPGTGTGATYRIVDFTTDYTSIHKAVGIVNSSGTTTTAGYLKTPGNSTPYSNYHTFLAGAIAAAQSALVAQNVVHPVAPGQNVIVMLTDGDSNVSDQYGTVVYPSMKLMASTFSVTASSPSYIPTLPSDIPITTTGTHVSYPSGVGGCGQAVEVAEAARASALQTSVFVVAYGALMAGSWNPANTALTSGNIDTIMGGTGASQSHCDSDQDAFFTAFKTTTTKGTMPTTIHGVTYTNLSYKQNITPCQTAQQIASPNTATVTYFYSDTMAGTAGTCPSTSSLTTLKQIFSAIIGQLPHIPRLVPIGTT